MTRAAAEFHAADFFALRAPLWPLDRVGATGTAAASNPARVPTPDGDAPGDLLTETDPARRLLASPELIEAIHVAAPAFLDALRSDHAQAAVAVSRQGVRSADSARRYLLRMAFRATPFGHFAGTVTGAIGGSTSLALGSAGAARKHVRLDSQMVLALTTLMQADEELLLAMPAVANASAYQVGAQVRYLERAPDGTEEDQFRLSSREYTPLLGDVLSCSATGPVAADLVALAERHGLARDEARAFVLDLLRSQLLVSALTPSVVGRDALDRLQALCDAHQPDGPWVDRLATIARPIDTLQRPAEEASLEAYAAVFAALRDVGVEPVPGRTLQVDVYYGEHTPTLSRSASQELLAGAVALHVLSAPSGRERFLANVREAFARRFGDRTVPLLELFDPTLGLGSPPLRDAFRPALDAARTIAQQKGRSTPAALTSSQQLLLRELTRAGAEGRREIAITPEQIDELASRTLRALPDSFAALASVYRPLDGADASGDVRFHLRWLSGPSAAGPFGRFMHGDPALRDGVERLMKAEQERRPEVLIAELNHTSGPRSPNVSRRPLGRDVEITTIGPTDQLSERAIPLNDLHVQLDDGRLTLWSASRGVQVVPRLASMHGVDLPRDLPLHAFLVALQVEDGTDYLGPEGLWGPLWRTPWLPRLRVGSVILTRETWLVEASEVAVQADNASAQLQALLRAKGVPRRAVLVERDHEMLLDLEQEWATRELLTALRVDGAARLCESLLDEHTGGASSSAGTHMAEVLVPYLSTSRRTPVSMPRILADVRLAAPRAEGNRLSPGSEWLYLKLYLPSAAMDAALCEQLAPACRALVAGSSVDTWFYLRYADGGDHLRLRLRLARDPWHRVYERLQETLTRLARTADLRIEIGTYEPEIRRYGGAAAMTRVERLFHLDSEFAVDLLRSLADVSVDDAIVRHAAALDHVLDALACCAPEKLRVVRHSLARFALQQPEVLRKQVGIVSGQLHRRLGRTLRGILGAENPTCDGWPASAADWLDAMRPVARELRACVATAGDGVIDRLISDLLHLHCNRVFASLSGEQEQLAYALLDRHYRAREAAR